jgi:hypothetical protein
LKEDEQRVSRLFEDAAREGISIENRSLSAVELQEKLVSGSCLIILLVDRRKLAADLTLPALCGIDEVCGCVCALLVRVPVLVCVCCMCRCIDPWVHVQVQLCVPA